MAETKNISKLNIDGTAYEIKDKTARDSVSSLDSGVSAHIAGTADSSLGHAKTGGDITFNSGVGTVTGVGGKKPAAASGLATLDGNIKVPIAQIPTGTTNATVALGKHTHTKDDITSVNASAITGTISVDNLPPAALERLVVVADDTARLALTKTNVQNGDTVKVTSSGKMYFVKDETKLGTETPANAFEEYTAGTASAVTWTGVTGKPSVSHTLTGDVTGTATATLGNAVSIEATIKNSGVNAGTYKAVTVNAKGIVTGGSNPTTLSGYGITDAYSKTETDSKISAAANKSLSASYNSATEELTLSIS